MRMAFFTVIESKITDMVAVGIGIDEISERLSISPEKTREHIKNIYNKIASRQTLTLKQATEKCLSF